jgi:hypothetical protein
MPEATLTFRFPGPRSYRGIAKTILVITLGAVLGYAMIVEDRANVARADSITYDEYVEEFDAYREGLTADALSPGGNILSGLAGVGVMVSLYEVLAWGLAWVIARVVRVVGGGRAAPVEQARGL